MKIFISWSGETSREVAEAFRGWLPSVIQIVVPYVSSEDIDKGARWSVDISSELKESNFGILCVTPENIDAPWLNFEAGALSKSFDNSKVSPFLFGVERSEVTGPLLQFQSTLYEEEDVRKLVKGINAVCQSPMPYERLDDIFDVWWPRLKLALDGIRDRAAQEITSDETSQQRPVEDVLDEILELVRSQQKLLTRPEDYVPMEFVNRLIEDKSREVREVIFGLEEAYSSVLNLTRVLDAAKSPSDSSLQEARAFAERAIIVMRRTMQFSEHGPRRVPGRKSPSRNVADLAKD